MSGEPDQVARLEAAIAAQDALRATLGDETVETAIAALRARLDTVRAESAPPAALQPASALEQLRARIPVALADKARIVATAARRGAERRAVTALFADLTGFTALNERLDPELIRAFQHDLFDELSAVVYEHEGFVEKFVGDAILAVFGAPVSHEDDAERALRAALGIRDRMDVLNGRWRDRLGEPLTVHIGINTGTVVAGQIGGQGGAAYAVTGDAITTASRLQSVAAPGQILVSANTHRAAHEAFLFRRLDAVQLKGKREPTAVFELLRARLQPGKSRGIPGLSSTLVGRDRELARLVEVGDELAAGRGAIVLVTGEAGLGKSRLMSEWRAGLARSARWLEGRCFLGASAMPYGPFLDMSRRYAGVTDEDGETEARSRLRRALARVLPGDAEGSAIVAGMLGMHLEPDEARVLDALTPQALGQRVVAFIERFFERLASARPTVLVIEDLHWADQSSVEILEHLLPLTERLPLAVVGVSRPSPDRPPIRPALLDRFAGRVVRVDLAPLPESATVELIRRLLSVDQLPLAARRLIVGKAEGNPFYVEEVIRSLIDRGAIARSEDGRRWVVTRLIESVTVPDTLHGVLMARLDGLPDATRRVAQRAAVVGRIFAFRVVSRLAAGDGLEADLRRLEGEGLIHELRRAPELEYGFKHALTQEVAYESLVAAERRELHARVGEAIEELFASRLGEYHGVLGAHYLRGERWERAFRHLRKAGDAATRLHAHPEAREHYAAALEALERMPLDDAVRRHIVNTTIKLVTVSWGAADPERNLVRLARAADLAVQLQGPTRTRAADVARLARVRYWMGVLHYLRDEPLDAIAYFRQVLAVGEQLGNEELLAMPSALIGRAMVMQGRFAEASVLLRRALDPLARAEDWLEWAYTLAFLGGALAAQGELARGRSESGRALARAIEEGNQTAIAGCQLAMSFFPLLTRDHEALCAAGRVAAQAGVDAGSALLVQIATCFEAWGLSRLGRHDAARERMADAQAVAEELGGRLFMADWVAGANAELALNAGRPDEAIELAGRALEMARAVEGLFGEALAHRVWGLALGRLGPSRGAEADEHLATSVARFEAGGSAVEAAHTRLAWGLALGDRGADARAEEQLRRAAAGFEAAALDAFAAEARRALARVAVSVTV